MPLPKTCYSQMNRWKHYLLHCIELQLAAWLGVIFRMDYTLLSLRPIPFHVLFLVEVALIYARILGWMNSPYLRAWLLLFSYWKFAKNTVRDLTKYNALQITSLWQCNLNLLNNSEEQRSTDTSARRQQNIIMNCASDSTNRLPVTKITLN